MILIVVKVNENTGIISNNFYLLFLENKVHQLQTISVTPLGKRLRPLTIPSPGKKISLMEKSRQEALTSITRTNASASKTSQNKPSTVTFRMRQPGRK